MNLSVFEIVSIASGIFPVLAAVYNYRELDNLLKILAVFFLISAMFDLALTISSALGKHNNMPLIHLFIVISILFLSTVYYKAFFNRLLKRTTLVLSIIALLIVFYFARNVWIYPSESNTVSGLLFIVLSLLYFYQLLTRQEFIHIEKQGLFWFNAGILFYYSVNIFLFMLFRQIISRHLEEYFIIHSITNIIANLLYTGGLLCKTRETA